MSWVTLQNCGTAALCQGEPPTCLAPACAAGEMTCAGAVLQRCNADRNGWDVFASCTSAAYCNADRRQCTADACTPGERRCDRSDIDQTPTLEACRSDRQDWEAVASCVTPELCNQTLHPSAGVGTLVQSSDGVPQLVAPLPDQVSTCALPACAVGETECQGARLLSCAGSRTGFELVEECATPALCQASSTNVSSTGTPACLPPACAANEHSCTEAGVLQVCNEDRSGFRVIQSCIGPAYCNATLADQGQEGCRATPCEAGQLQCNHGQVQVCRADRSGLDDSGAPCASAPLCNTSDPAHPVCDPPSCRRGPTSGDEFRCDGSALQRCNESLTGYDTIDTCANAALCDASQRFKGCQAPACQPSEHVCKDGTLQTCKADLSGFEDTTSCGSAAACDSSAGQCVTPCETGSVRCNSQSGDLEECRDQAGWQTIAACLSLALCDVTNRRCNDPACAIGERRCETRDGNPAVVECAPGRDTFNVSRSCAPGQICDAQNNECDVCSANSVRCEGDTLVTCDARGQSESRQTCGAGLCSEEAHRCLACGPIGSARCTSQQLLVCSASPQGEFEASEFCATDALCAQTLDTCGAGLNGQNCQCNPGTCRANQVTCNGAQVQRCNTGLTGYDTIATCAAPELCNQATADCNACVATQFSCTNGQLQQCANDGRSFARQNISLECASANQLRVCNGASAGTQNCPNGCTNGRGCNQCTGNGVQCINGNTIRRCVSGFFQDESCVLGCNQGATQCNACQGNGSSCLNSFTEQVCSNGQFRNDNCTMGCVQGRCANCTAAQCAGNQRRDCVGGQLQNATSCDDGDFCTGTESCVGAGNCVHNNPPNCNDNNPCNGVETCSAGRCMTVPGTAPAAGSCCTGPTCGEAESYLDCVNNVPTFVIFCSELGFVCVPDPSVMCRDPAQ